MRKVKDVRADTERLHEHLEAGGDGCEFDICGLVKETVGILNKLADYEDLEEQGRLIRLPCVVGDTVYRIESDKTISKWFVYGIIKFDGLAWEVNAKNNKNKWRYVDITIMFSDFGKIVFLTREEAEAKLKELKEEKQT